MAEGFGGLPMAAHNDWVDAVILWACQWRPFNTYVYWHCRHKWACRALWWGVIPATTGVIGWWLRGI